MLSRRQLIATSLALGTATAVPKAFAQTKKRIIVDAQVHLWTAISNGTARVGRRQNCLMRSDDCPLAWPYIQGRSEDGLRLLPSGPINLPRCD